MNAALVSFLAAALVVIAASCCSDAPEPAARSVDEFAWLRSADRITWSPLINVSAHSTEVAVVPARDVTWNQDRVASYVFVGDGLCRAGRASLREDSLYVVVTIAPRDGRALCFGGCDICLTSPELDDVVLRVWPGWSEVGETTRAFFRLPEVPRLRVGPVAHRVSAFSAK